MSRLGEFLINESLITQEQLADALTYQKTNGGRLGSVLIKLGYVSDEALTAILAREYGLTAVNLSEFEVDAGVINLVPRDIASKHHVLPLTRLEKKLLVAMADPTDISALDELKFITGLNLEPVVASASQVQAAIEKFYTNQQDVDLKKVMGTLSDVEVLEEEAEELDIRSLERDAQQAPVVALVNWMLFDAVKRGASDIHIESYENDVQVRFRVDGVLQKVMSPPFKYKDAITSRIKVLARLDISEKRLPQDGRIKIRMKVDGKSRELDFRVNTLPTLFGEKVAIRLLDKAKLMLDLSHLGFEPESLQRFEKAIRKPFGMVLVTGPTGSGKTSTLYSAISQLNNLETHIVTAEDPIEFNLRGINQVQMKESIGLNFAAALRAFLRQDPNIILVGEIRDFETAEIAITTALTGHLVLSTLHTNDGPSTVVRLVSMGVEPFLVATSLQLVCAQRLVRRICSECKEEVKYPRQALIDFGFTPDEIETVQIFRGAGCSRCLGNGYRGRVGLYEVMEISDDLREMIVNGASALALRERATANGMIALRRSGLIKIKAGMTTIEEVLRETVS